MRTDAEVRGSCKANTVEEHSVKEKAQLIIERSERSKGLEELFRIFEFQITEFSNEDNKMPEMRKF